jgi:hypothetical protein
MVVGTADRNLIVFDLKNPQTEYKRIVSPLKQQTRCVAAFPDQQGFLVCIHPIICSKTFALILSNENIEVLFIEIEPYSK